MTEFPVERLLVGNDRSGNCYHVEGSKQLAFSDGSGQSAIVL